MKVNKQTIGHVLGLTSFFLFLVQNIWTFIETKSFMGEKFFLFLAISILLAALFYYLFTIVQERIFKKNISYQIEDILKDYQNLVDRFEKDEKYFELLSAKWRVEVELGKIKNIDSGEWTIQALKTYEYLRYVFGQILNLLNKGDKYTTLSNLDFWSKQRYGDTDFITMNVEAANREVQINRIIVIDENIFINPSEHEEEIKTLKRIIQEFKDNFLPNSTADRYTENYFYLSSDYINDISPPYPFALIETKNNSSKIAVLPNIITEKDNPDIDIKFYSALTAKHFILNQARYDKLLTRNNRIFTPAAIEFKLNNMKGKSSDT